MYVPKLLIAALLFVFSAASGAADMCKLDKLKSVPANDPACYFYSGTASFRGGNYSDAAASWTKLVSLKSVPVDLEHFRTSAYNNLGYLYFFGRGVKKDKALAIQYWNYATRAGNEESAYHLCHAYGEKNEPTYNPKIALTYCKEALRRYNQLPKGGEGGSDVVRQINAYIARLEKI